jgi:hypothetical protein
VTHTLAKLNISDGHFIIASRFASARKIGFAVEVCLHDRVTLGWSQIAWGSRILLQFDAETSQMKEAAGFSGLTEDKRHEAGKALTCLV